MHAMILPSYARHTLLAHMHATDGQRGNNSTPAYCHGVIDRYGEYYRVGPHNEAVRDDAERAGGAPRWQER